MVFKFWPINLFSSLYFAVGVISTELPTVWQWVACNFFFTSACEYCTGFNSSANI